MTLRMLTLGAVFTIALLLPGGVAAQEFTFSGTVTDTTGECRYPRQS